MATGFQQSAPGFPRRIILVILLVVSLVLAAVYAREGSSGPLHSIQSALGTASSPVQYAGSYVSAAADAASDSITDATASDATLTALREQNEELRQLLAQADEYKLEVERLQALLNMKSDQGVEGIAAKVVGRSIEAWDQTITINVGTADGVESGMTVMGSSGVIGQISRADEHRSEVRLLTDPNSGAAVMIQATRAGGIVRGSLEGLLYLEDIDVSQIPEVGDVVITSGLGGSYEAGLMVGTVVSVNKSTSNATGTIVVDPNDSVSALEEVIVVTGTSASSTVAATTAAATASSSSSASDDSSSASSEQND